MVALSIMEAEHIPVVHTSKEAIWLKRLLGDFKVKQDIAQVNYDSQNVLHLGKKSTFFSRMKYINWYTLSLYKRCVDWYTIAVEGSCWCKPFRYIDEATDSREIQLEQDSLGFKLCKVIGTRQDFRFGILSHSTHIFKWNIVGSR